MDKFKNKYRIPSARLQSWDYAKDAAYFITICTQNHLPIFGEIKNGNMHLSHVGVIADILWHEIRNHVKQVELGAFVVMPNHVHGILILNGNNDCTDVAEDKRTDDKRTDDKRTDDKRTDVADDKCTDVACNVSTPPPPKNIQMATISPKSNSVSSIIRSYKSAVTRHARRLGYEMEWQTRFHDHIIRDARSFENITNYIINNPANWNKDELHNEQ
jgi:putative transposase